MQCTVCVLCYEVMFSLITGVQCDDALFTCIQDLNMKMGKETVYMKLRKKVLSPQNLTVVELVYGAAGMVQTR